MYSLAVCASSTGASADTRPPTVTNISHSIDPSNHPLVVFGCDEMECLYECSLHSTALNPSEIFSPCWGGFRVPAALQQAAIVNLSVRAVDRAGNRGQPALYAFVASRKSVSVSLWRKFFAERARDILI